MPLRASQWAPKRELQNAKFESYKLSFDDDEDERIHCIKFARDGALPGRMLAAGPASDLRLGYKDARNRAKWNHLAAGQNGAVAWIDREGVFWLAELSQSNASPVSICTLPQPIGQASASSSSFPAEYPVARYLQGSIWVASDGAGRLYIVDAKDKAIQASHDFVSDTGSLIPFRLHCARLHQDAVIAIVSSSVPTSDMSFSSARISEKAKEFQVDVLRIPLASKLKETDSTPLQSALSLRGSDLPLYAGFVGERCCLGSTTQYRLASTASLPTNGNSLSSDIKSESEAVSVPRSGEEPSVIPTSLDNRPPPYSWNQQSDSVTIVFPLPSHISAKDIKIVFRPNIVSMVVSSDKTKEGDLPKLLSAKLWGDIDAGISTWTWEKVGGSEGKYGLLSLHLEKKHEDTRWPHVFKQDGNPELEKRYLNVEETLDRSELAKITEALDKFTRDAANGGMAGIQQRSSLLGDEMDEEVDMSELHEGRGVQFTWIDNVNETPSLASGTHAEMAEVVSLPLPRAQVGPDDPDYTIVIKHDVDGLLFTPSSVPSESSWTHTSTFPALAFVLASKRDVVQVYHSSDQLCVALESGSPVGSQNTNASSSYSSLQTAKMNAYLYYPPPPGSKAKTAKQKVLSLADPSAGAVLGAVSIKRSEKGLDIAVLCERELAVIKDAVAL